MSVAAIYDIHANLPALEAVLAEVREAGVDQIVVGGDVLPGPMPRETLTLLQQVEAPIQFLYGNGEVAVLEQMAGKKPAGIPEQYAPAIRWTGAQLDSEHERMLASWPKTVRFDVHGLGDVLFCHATPRNENEIFTRLTDESRLVPIFENIGAAVVVCGHTHMQFDRTIGGVRVVNAGSVGMPFGQPGAHWVLLGPDIRFRRTAYDLSAAANRIRETGYPGADEFAAHYLLQVPDEEKMLELFQRAEVK